MRLTKDNIIFALIGIIIGIVFTAFCGAMIYITVKGGSAGSMQRFTRGLERQVQHKKAAKGNFKNFYLSFEKSSDLGVFKPSGTALAEISNAHPTHGKRSLMLKISPGSDYPGLQWEEYGSGAQNWSGVKDFHFDVFNNSEDSVQLTVKFKSGREYPKKSFSYSVTLEPLKENAFSIPLEQISQYCDVTQMSYVKMFMKSPKNEVILYFDNIGTRSGEKNDEKSDKDDLAKIGAIVLATGLKKDTDIFVASSLDRIFQDGKTLLKPNFTSDADILLARNEYASFQVVVTNGNKELRDVWLKISDLVNKDAGVSIKKNNISWRIVGYVPTKKPYYPVKVVGLWPDPLLPAQKINISPGITQPFWVTVYAPCGTKAGIYKGKIEIISGDTKLTEIPINARVENFTLPLESHLKTAFDFYGHITSNRYPRADKETGQGHASRIEELNELFIINMLKHRMNPILNIDPSSQRDLGRVEKYMSYGLTNFAIGKKGGTFNNNWPITDEGIEKLLPVYRGYGEYLKINKMLQYAYLYTWDESKLHDPIVAKVCSMVHRAYPQLKNMVCYHGFWDPQKYPDWGKDIDIWCFGIDNFNEKKINTLRDLGMEMWMYISGPSGSGAPNLAIDFDSIDYRIIPWLCWKFDLKGFLYWCVNWWPFVNPFYSAANTKWEQNGNGLLFYPGDNGPIDSLRAEIFREGMQDYEYLYLLAKKVEILRSQEVPAAKAAALKEAEKMLEVDHSIASSLRSFTKDAKVLLGRREKIGKLIEELTEDESDNVVSEVKIESEPSQIICSNTIKNTEDSADKLLEELKKDSCQMLETFSSPIEASSGKRFGPEGKFSFELYRGGTFIIDGKSKFAWQKSDNYGDVCLIRSTEELPKTYKITVIVGDINYGLENIAGLKEDTRYNEGPLGENGVYLIAITDELPIGHHTNDWWHQHRKVVMDVDNNKWGCGMSNPIFMIYFDKENKLVAHNRNDQWEYKWDSAINYNPKFWYKIVLEKNKNSYKFLIYDASGKLLNGGIVPLSRVWHSETRYPDYFVIGDPHENYYQGSMKIKAIAIQDTSRFTNE